MDDTYRGEKQKKPISITELLRQNAELKEKISELETTLQTEVEHARTETQKKARRRINKERRKAQTDPLTGAYNREGLDRKMRGIGTDYTVILIDLDKFKTINDTYGHDKGDDVLRKFVRTIAQQTRPEDIFARYGGEEFILIMPGCDIYTARRKAEHLQDIIASDEFHTQLALPQPITFSAGLAYATREEPYPTAITLADKKLYEAKKERNTICG